MLVEFSNFIPTDPRVQRPGLTACGAAFRDPVQEEEGRGAIRVDIKGLSLFVRRFGVWLVWVREVAEGTVGTQKDVENLSSWLERLAGG